MLLLSGVCSVVIPVIPEMSPSMNFAEIAVTVDVDSVGKVERQTKDIAMCAILLSNFYMWH